MYPGVLIHFSLDYCIYVKTGVVQIQRLLWNLWCFAKDSVCSWRVQDHLFGVCCVIKVLDFLVNSQRFMRTGCSSWLSVNQHKLFVLIFVSLLFFKFVFNTADKNIWLFRKNNRLIFWNHIKNSFGIGWIDFYLIDSSLVFNLPSTFAKIFHKQLVSELSSSFKFFILKSFSWLKNYPLERVSQLTDHLCFVVWSISFGR